MEDTGTRARNTKENTHSMKLFYSQERSTEWLKLVFDASTKCPREPHGVVVPLGPFFLVVSATPTMVGTTHGSCTVLRSSANCSSAMLLFPSRPATIVLVGAVWRDPPSYRSCVLVSQIKLIDCWSQFWPQLSINIQSKQHWDQQCWLHKPRSCVLTFAGD